MKNPIKIASYNLWLFLNFSFLFTFIYCATPTENMTYYYTDLNNNSYKITSTHLQYDPIKPAESSSGSYDGGEPVKVVIDKKTFTDISKKADSLMATSEIYTTSRKMLTAILSMERDGRTTRCMIMPSNERTDFEALLRRTKQKTPKKEL